MIPRWRAATVPAPEGQPPAAPGGGRPGLGARLQRLLRPGGGPGGSPASGTGDGKRRWLLTAALALYLVVLVAGALAYNLPLLREQAVLRGQAERETLRIAGMQRLMAELDRERVRGVELAAERLQRYRQLPAEADLPVAVEQLRQLPALSGGAARGVDYSEPRWSGNNGQLQTHATFSGTWREALAYIAALDGVLPESALERLAIRFDGPGRVAVDLLVSAAALRERPEGAPAWDAAAAWQRAQAAAQGTAPAGSPFMPGALLWQEAAAAGMGLPELRLAGIARQEDGAAVALLVYGGEARLVRPGGRVGPVEVLAIDSAGVVVDIGGRAFKLQVGKPPQPW